MEMILRLKRVVGSCWLGDKGESGLLEIGSDRVAYRDLCPQSLAREPGDAGSIRVRNDGSASKATRDDGWACCLRRGKSCERSVVRRSLPARF